MDCVADVTKHPIPGETISGKTLNYFPGGKGANQAVAASKLGMETLMFGMVGNDAFSKDLKDFLQSQNVDISNVSETDCSTGTALIAVDKQGENTIIVIPGANSHASYEQVENFTFKETDTLICQNEVRSDEMVSVFKKAKQGGATIIYNPAPAITVPTELFKLSDYVIVNETEVQFYLNTLDTEKHVIIETLGADGVKVTSKNNSFHVAGIKTTVVDTTGAGDCFTGAFATKLTNGSDLKEAVSFANKVATLSIQKNGASVSMPFLEDVEKS